jgi:CDP-diacylglycerol--glycerol-3-phosphate 3-phosphatidyltransferase
MTEKAVKKVKKAWVTDIIDSIISATILPLLPKIVTPNHITAFRFATIPFVVYFLVTGEYFFGTVLFVISALSDGIDGALARTKNMVTDWGKMYDPLADKLLIGSAAAILVSKYLSHELALAIILIELIIVIEAFYRKRFLGRDIQARMAGKIKMCFQVLGVFFLMLFVLVGTPWLLVAAEWTLYVSILFALVGLFVYRSI